MEYNSFYKLKNIDNYSYIHRSAGRVTTLNFPKNSHKNWRGKYTNSGKI